MSNATDSALENLDAGLMDSIAALYDVVDPPPPSLDDDVIFALSLGVLDAEIATLTEEVMPAMRSGEAEATNTVTFTSSALQLMIRTVEEDDGTLRIDGWVTGGGIDVAVLSGANARWSTSDAHGRLLWRNVTRGALRFLLRPADPADRPVMTPVIEF